MNLTEKANEQRAKLSREFLQIQARTHLGTATAEDIERLSAVLDEYKNLLKDPNNLEKR